MADEGDWIGRIDTQEQTGVAEAMARVRAELEANWTRKSQAAALQQRDRLLAESPWRELEVVEAGPYLMEGESGQWSFKTYRVVERGCRRALYDTRQALPAQRGCARQRTPGFRELALFFGSGKQSFRDCRRFLDRVRHQNAVGATTTLRDFVEREGDQISASLSAEVTRVLAVPLAPSAEPATVAVEPAQMQEAITQAQIPDALREEAMANPVAFTSPDRTVNVSADAVCCKRQKAHRAQDKPNPKDRRRTVSTCCASVNVPGRHLALAAMDYTALAWAVLATLITNDLLPMACCLLSDGERKLREDIIPILASKVTRLHHVLDWYHLRLRCGQLLSLALKGKVVRNTRLNELLRFLWHGCPESAIRFLDTIPPTEIKARQPIQDLAEYLARHKEQIPVYSVRKALGLANSSNAVEKTNDLLVSCRQKGRGMSWSPEGSFSLASVCMVGCNRQEKPWLEKGQLSLVMTEEAA